MTLPYERTNAVLATEKLLVTMLTYPRVPKALREAASGCLRHYPSKHHLEIAAAGFNSSLMECPFEEPNEK